MNTTKIKVLLERHIGRINRKILKIEQLEIKIVENEMRSTNNF